MTPLEEAGLASLLSPSRFPQLVKTLGEYFVSRGTSAYLVGGVVRDAVLDRETGDIDVAVAGDTREVGAEIAALLKGRSILMDAARGTVRVVVLGDEDGTVIDLTPLDGGLDADLGRRDFTLDAMAVRLSDSGAEAGQVEIIDPYHGTLDLREGVIRAVSPSVFEADPARLVRAPRLAAQLGFSIADETAEAISRHADLITTVAPERVRDEFLKLLAQHSTAASLRLLDDLGLLCRIVPELAEAKGVTQPKEHYWDVFEHSIETAGQVERLLQSRLEDRAFVVESLPHFGHSDEYFATEVSDGHTRLTMLKLAGLLHDIAKPATRTVEESGRIRFLGHHQAGAETSTRILGRLRLSRRGIELVSSMVEHHLRPSQMAQDGELPSAKALYRYHRDVGDATIDTLYLNMADYLAARGPYLSKREWTDHCLTIDHILQAGLARGKAPEPPPRLVDGHDIISTFSLLPGPMIGSLLELVNEAQGSGDISSRDEALRLIESELGSGDAGA